MIHDKAHDIKLKTNYIQYIHDSCSRHTVKLATFPRTRNAVCFGSQIGVCFLARVVVFCAWAYTLGRAFLSGTAGGGGGAGGAGAGEVCPTG